MILQGNECIILLVTITSGMVLGVVASSRNKSSIDDPSLSQIRHGDIENKLQLKTVNKRRVARSVTAPGKNCDQWAEWVNDHHPTTSHKEDHEFIPQKTLHDFCPLGIISKFECKDGNGEAFHTNATAGDGKYFISCYNIYVGVTCTVLDQSLKQCPDLSIRYLCSCPILPPSPAVSEPVPVDHETQTDKLANGTTLNFGSFSIPWWAFVLVVTGLLFITSTCISICLYRKATHGLEKKHKSAVHPLHSV